MVGAAAALLLHQWAAGPAAGVVAGLLVAVVGTVSAYEPTIAPTEPLRWSISGLRQYAMTILVAAPAAGSAFGGIWGLGAGRGAGPEGALVVGTGAALGAALYLGVQTRLELQPVRPGSSIVRSRRDGLTSGLGIAVTILASVTAPSVLTDVVVSTWLGPEPSR